MEIVESEIEKVLPAYRAAIHCELLSEAEVKQLLLQRRQGESRLIKREVAREDYVNYVARDAIMLKLLQKRRKKTNYTHKISEIEYVFVGKLNRVMKRAHRLWPNDERIWATHVALLEKWNKRTQLSKLYEEYTARFPHNVNIWLEAVRFQIERNGSADQARKLLYRAQQNNANEPLIYDQLFRVELVNATILRKRLEITGSVESESNNIELVDGAAAIKVVELAAKTFPENGHLILSMLRASQKCENSFEKVNAMLVDILLKMDSISGLSARAEYYLANVTNGLDLAKNVYQSELTKERQDEDEVLTEFMLFLARNNCQTELASCIERCDALCAKIEKIPECLKGGKIVEIIVDNGNKDFAYKLQQRIVTENERDEDEQLRLLIMMVQNEKDGVKEKLFHLIKKGSERIKYAAEEMAIHWSGENEERLCWFSSISAVGRRHYIGQLKSDKAIVEKVLQFSASKPIDQDFVEFGLMLLKDPNQQLAFANKCCHTEPNALSFVELLKLTQKHDLSNLNAIMTRARGVLNGEQYERMHQLWQDSKE